MHTVHMYFMILGDSWLKDTCVRPSQNRVKKAPLEAVSASNQRNASPKAREYPHKHSRTGGGCGGVVGTIWVSHQWFFMMYHSFITTPVGSPSLMHRYISSLSGLAELHMVAATWCINICLPPQKLNDPALCLSHLGCWKQHSNNIYWHFRDSAEIDLFFLWKGKISSDTGFN